MSTTGRNWFYDVLKGIAWLFIVVLSDFVALKILLYFDLFEKQDSYLVLIMSVLYILLFFLAGLVLRISRGIWPFEMNQKDLQYLKQECKKSGEKSFL